MKALLRSFMALVAIVVATTLVALPAHAAKKKTDTDQTKTTQTRDAKGRFVKKEKKATTNAPARDSKGRFVKKETDKASPTTSTSATTEPKSSGPARDSKGRFVKTGAGNAEPEAATPAPATRTMPARDAQGRFVSTKNAGSPGAGMVWVNTESKVYHVQGDQWYGKTKNGKYMSEQDAIKAGYRASKTGPKTGN